jgi:mannose-1-phosphate guanylyltransferase
MIIPVILSGGSGTRLWPLSRELYPKQLIAIYNESTMLQNTLSRLDGVKNVANPIVVCNEEHRFMTADQLRIMGCKPHSIILEPIGKNTAPAIALAAFKAMETQQDPVLLILPADHVIENIKNFHTTIKNGEALSRDGHLITFGIIPDAPETGYGYIKKGIELDHKSLACKIDKFVEKPDLKTAEKYIASKKYCWNSGIFMFTASAIVSELEKVNKEIVMQCRKSIEKGNQDLDFFRISKKDFNKVSSVSVDYAVMEKTSKGVMIPFDAGWNDLGSFDTLWQAGDKDKNKNVLKGDIITHDVTDSYISSESRLVAAVGVEKLVIVETKDAVLVAPREKVQDVKTIVEVLKKNHRDEPVNHRKVFRPWGTYETIDISDRFQVKRISVPPKGKLSFQKHHHRAEHWTVVSGTALVTKGDTEMMLREDESTYIPLGVKHRLENLGKIDLELIEVQSGSYLGEDDIVRFDDVYGRKKD